MRAQAEAVREKCNNNLWEFNVQRSRRDTGLIFTHRLQELEKHLEDATAEVERIDHFIAQIGRWIDELHHQKAEQEVPLSALRQTAAL